MTVQSLRSPVTARCVACQEGQAFPTPFSMAFQPIVDTSAGQVWAYEALVRGLNGEGAQTVLSAVDDTNLYAFDQACRVKAIEVGSRLGIAARDAKLSINFLPNAVYRPEACIRATLKAAERTGFPTDRLMFEITESERVVDHAHLQSIISAYRSMGFTVAIDDFGAGFSNLTLLARFQPDVIKLDMELTRGIDGDAVRKTIVKNLIHVCDDLGITVVAEGIETLAEYETVAERGVKLFQGWLFAKAAFEALPPVALP